MDGAHHSGPALGSFHLATAQLHNDFMYSKGILKQPGWVGWRGGSLQSLLFEPLLARS